MTEGGVADGAVTVGAVTVGDVTAGTAGFGERSKSTTKMIANSATTLSTIMSPTGSVRFGAPVAVAPAAPVPGATALSAAGAAGTTGGGAFVIIIVKSLGPAFGACGAAPNRDHGVASFDENAGGGSTGGAFDGGGAGVADESGVGAVLAGIAAPPSGEDIDGADAGVADGGCISGDGVDDINGDTGGAPAFDGG